MPRPQQAYVQAFPDPTALSATPFAPQNDVLQEQQRTREIELKLLGEIEILMSTLPGEAPVLLRFAFASLISTRRAARVRRAGARGGKRG